MIHLIKKFKNPCKKCVTRAICHRKCESFRFYAQFILASFLFISLIITISFLLGMNLFLLYIVKSTDACIAFNGVIVCVSYMVYIAALINEKETVKETPNIAILFITIFFIPIFFTLGIYGVFELVFGLRSFICRYNNNLKSLGLP